MTLLEPPRQPVREHVTTVRPRPRRLVPVAVAGLLTVAVAAGAIGTTMLRGDGEQAAGPTTSGPPGAGTPEADTRGGDGTTTNVKSGDTTTTTKKSGSKSTTPKSGPAKVTGMKVISGSKGAAKLRAAGITPYGKASYAVSWTDRNGQNLVFASTRETTENRGDLDYVTKNLRVVHVAHLESTPVVLRTMNDAGASPCELNLDSEFTADYMLMGDLDKDGYGEVTVSWFSGCNGDPGEYSVKTALLSNGNKYVLRGLGWPGGLMPEIPGDWKPGHVTDTEPAAAQWPTGFRQEAKNVFLRLFA